MFQALFQAGTEGKGLKIKKDKSTGQTRKDVIGYRKRYGSIWYGYKYIFIF